MILAFAQCHRETRCWCQRIYPWWDRPEFCGGAPIALESLAKLENQAKVVYHYFYSFKPLVEFVQVAFL
jgi:hypothetical protein